MLLWCTSPSFRLVRSLSVAALPAIALQIEPRAAIELHSLRFQQQPLQFVRIAAGARADLTFCIYDTMPGNVAFGGEVVQGVTDLPCVSFEAGQLRDLTVCGDAPARHFPHHRPDELVAFQRSAIVRCTGFRAPKSRV